MARFLIVCSSLNDKKKHHCDSKQDIHINRMWYTHVHKIICKPRKYSALISGNENLSDMGCVGIVMLDMDDLEPISGIMGILG